MFSNNLRNNELELTPTFGTLIYCTMLIWYHIEVNMCELSMHNRTIRIVDLFCGIGGFRIACQNAAKSLNIEVKCVLSCDIDKDCQSVYYANFGELPLGDITQINEYDIPDHDILLAGFPCQPFSIIGDRKGFVDTRGTLFFDVARVIEAKKPQSFILENVKQLVGHNQGQTLKKILAVLTELGYTTSFKVLNALNYGLPQKRERVFIVGTNKNFTFEWPEEQHEMTPLSDILETSVESKHYVSEYISKKHSSLRSDNSSLEIWHENKAGHISKYPYSCALRASASYNYLLVNGERRLTPREMLRLQGYPDSFKIISNDSQARKQAGNSLPIPVAQEVIKQLLTGFTEKPRNQFNITELRTDLSKRTIPNIERIEYGI